MSDDLTDADLEAIGRRVNRASSGPWVSATTDPTPGPDDVIWSRDRYIARQVATDGDCKFMAHAREDVPRLVAEVRRLRAELADLTPTVRPVNIEDLEG